MESPGSQRLFLVYLKVKLTRAPLLLAVSVAITEKLCLPGPTL